MSHPAYSLLTMEGEILFKKNQLALILLTLVMMLTVYYIKTPSEKPNTDDPDVPSGTTTGRLEPLTAMRLTLKSERNDSILALDAIIASSESTPTQINAAIEQKVALTELTESELLLELQIIALGYQDAFVHSTGKGVEVTVVSDEHSITKANEIILMTISGFNTSFSNVCVEFETVSEVMGIVEEAA